MILPGYLDGWQPSFDRSPLIDGAPLIHQPLFWPAFLYTVGGAASAPDAFDADPADLDVLIDELCNPARWPVFTLPLGNHTLLRIVMRNHPDDAGVDYLLDRGDDTPVLHLAALEGHFKGPALSWPELASTIEDTGDGHAAVDRFLLLLPAFGDTDTPAAAHRLVTHVVTTVGAIRDQPTLAAQLLENRRYWAPSTWTTVNDVLVCLGPYSPRRPDGPLSTTDLKLVATAFTSTATRRRSRRSAHPGQTER
ncbi:hypothetical protein [Dactylosporangium sp. CA-233914]|uniref:hypothetical protein n=1 Tax=Dactylosporangium sp. CA-233914 TaxID=3239934 RepID=UPI003D91BA34